MKKFDRVEIVCIIAVALIVVSAGHTYYSLIEGTVNAEEFEDIIIVDVAFAEEFNDGQKVKWDDKDYKFDSKRCVFVLEEPEPNEPKYYHPLNPRAYTCPKCYKGAKGDLCPGHIEPNESEPSESMTTYTAEELDEIYKDEPALGRLAKDLWGVGEGRIKITDLNEPMKYSLPIPTWPDYIELEKDLYIEIPIERFGPIETRCYVYRKGTKIYFKDN